MPRSDGRATSLSALGRGLQAGDRPTRSRAVAPTRPLPTPGLLAADAVYLGALAALPVGVGSIILAGLLRLGPAASSPGGTLIALGLGLGTLLAGFVVLRGSGAARRRYRRELLAAAAESQAIISQRLPGTAGSNRSSATASS